MENERHLHLNDRKEWNLGVIADIASIVNGVAGIIAIYATFMGEFYLSVRVMSLGVLLDALDGYLGRKAKLPTKRRRGIYIDSVCDGITFGLYPAALYLAFFQKTTLVVVPAGVYVVTAWYRLARYTQEADIDRFRGFPSPGAAAITSSFLILFKLPVSLVAVFFVTVAILMASKIPYPSFKRPRGVEKIFLSGTGIVAGLFVVLPASVGIFTLILLFLLSVVYVLVGPFWIRSAERRNHVKKREQETSGKE